MWVSPGPGPQADSNFSKDTKQKDVGCSWEFSKLCQCQIANEEIQERKLLEISAADNSYKKLECQSTEGLSVTQNDQAAAEFQEPVGIEPKQPDTLQLS